MGMKGISPIIASVVLIAVSIAVGVMISSWVTQWVSSKTSGVSTECVIRTNYKIDSAEYNVSGGNLTLIVMNLDSIDIYGFSMQIRNDTTIVSYNSSNPDVAVSPNVTSGEPLKNQRSAIIKITMNGRTGDYSALGNTMKSIRVFNQACPGFSTEVLSPDIKRI